jgi:hypothetical protein
LSRYRPVIFGQKELPDIPIAFTERNGSCVATVLDVV